MTPDQQTRCAALAKRIAELDKGWFDDGMACRNNDIQWRYIGFNCLTSKHVWLQVYYDGEAHFPAPTLGAPIMRGPDYTDDCTLGALLLSLGDIRITGPLSDGRCWISKQNYGGWFDTRAEAILAAVVAKLEAP